MDTTEDLPAPRTQESRRLARDGVTVEAVNQAKDRIGTVFAAYPGIVAGRAESGRD